MKKLFTILLWALCACFFIPKAAAQTNFSFTAIPLGTDFLNADRGAHLWINRDAPFGTIDIPVNNAPQEMVDGYYRFSFTHFFTGTGIDSTINWSFFRARMGEFTAKRMGIKFRIMANGKNIGNPPSDNFNNLQQYGGGWSNIPEFLHNLQQAEPNAANRDYFSTFGGGYGSWIPNTNSPQFQRWVRKFSQQLRNYIDTAVINGWPLRHAIRIYDIGFYGCFSEQHSACLCNTIGDGNIPAGARHTAAGLIEIVDAQMDAMGGNPNWKYVIPFNAYDAIWLSHTFNPVEYGQHLLDHSDSISHVNDHLGAVEGYDDDYLDFNNRMGGSYNAKLMNRWKYSPLGGEPVGWGSPADRSGITQYVTHYHLSGFGNGNLDHIGANGQDDDGWPTEANNIRTASRLAGYRIRPTGGSANVGASLTINLNWLNEGNAPVYFDWDVKYLIKNGAGTTVSTLSSTFDVRYFQPSGSATTHTQAFGIPAVPAGQYGLYVKVVDPNGYRRPMRLAITPAQADTSYFLGNITIPTGGTNQPPVANAGPNQSITGSSTTLTSTGSSDPDGTITAFAWSRISGPGTPTIVSPTAASTSVTGLLAGTHIFNLTVTDNNGATGSDQVTVTVNTNQPPVAQAGPNQAITLPTSSVTVNGSGSTDDIAIASYAWSHVGGPTTFNIVSPSSASTTINGLTDPGVYTFRLTVADASGLTSTDDVQITVNNSNQPPVANAGANQTITATSTTVNGLASFDDNGITAYLWTQVGGPVTATITSPTTVGTGINGLSTLGQYIFRLSVQDAQGLFSTDDMMITVNAPGNMAPVANAGPNHTVQIPVNFAQLNGTGSTDDVGIVTYLWTKESGPGTFSISFPNNAITNVEGLQIGVYVFRLTVTDGQGLTSFDEATVTVLPPGNTAPIAVAGNNQSITLPTTTTSFDGSASSDDHGIINSLWTLVSKPVGSPDPVIATPGNLITNISNLTTAGIYTFRLTVDDQEGLIGTDDISVTVNAAANNAPVAIITITVGAQTIQLPANSVTLSGVTSTDDVAVTAYAWSQISGPSAATIATPSADATDMDNLIAGVYFFQLMVSDAGGLTDTDVMQITVLAADPPDPPVVNGRWLWKVGVKFLPRHGHP